MRCFFWAAQYSRRFAALGAGALMLSGPLTVWAQTPSAKKSLAPAIQSLVDDTRAWAADAKLQPDVDLRALQARVFELESSTTGNIASHFKKLVQKATATGIDGTDSTQTEGKVDSATLVVDEMTQSGATAETLAEPLSPPSVDVGTPQVGAGELDSSTIQDFASQFKTYVQKTAATLIDVIDNAQVNGDVDGVPVAIDAITQTRATADTMAELMSGLQSGETKLDGEIRDRVSDLIEQAIQARDIAQNLTSSGSSSVSSGSDASGKSSQGSPPQNADGGIVFARPLPVIVRGPAASVYIPE